MELVLVLPILGLVLMALFEFSVLLSARGTVVRASHVAARSAALPGVRTEDVEEQARRILGPRLRRGMEVHIVRGEHTGDKVVVAVSVPMRAAAPDLLWPVGFSLTGRELYAETRMVKE